MYYKLTEPQKETIEQNSVPNRKNRTCCNKTMNLVLILRKRDVNLTTRSITYRINLKNKTSEKEKYMNVEENNAPDRNGIATILRS